MRITVTWPKFGLISGVLLTLILTQPHPVNLNPSTVVPFRFTDSVTKKAIEQAPTAWISITPYHGDWYFVCGNNDIYLLNARTNQLTLLPYHSAQKTGYTPTAIHYSPTHQKLFVANYPGNNILTLAIQSSPDTHLPVALQGTGSINHPSLVSPEGIAMSRDGQYMASANCDGNTVTVFKWVNNRFVYQWHRAVKGAHGVAIADNHVYVTGLEEHKLFDMDLTRGTTLRTLGKFSNRVSQNGMLWPTHIQVTDDHELVLTDAHTGSLSFYNLSNFQLKRTIGHNGASYQNLNLPYASLIDHNRLIILSTFQDRILMGQRTPMHFEKSLVRSARDWAYANTIPSTRLPAITRKGYRNYTRVGGGASGVFKTALANGVRVYSP